MNTLLSASILAADFRNLSDQIHQAEDAGVDWIHIDVMDGTFVKNISMGPIVVDACRKITSLPLDVHLMIVHPENHVQSFIDAGANYLTVQAETCPDLPGVLQNIKDLGCKAGVAINPATPINNLETGLGIMDMMLVMTVIPGKGGQSYMMETTDKIIAARKMIEMSKRDILLEVDGGINLNTIAIAKNAGAEVFVAGSAIFQSAKGIMNAVQGLRNAAS